MLSHAPEHCPVCRAPECAPLGLFDGQAHWHCTACQARGLDPTCYPDPRTELAVYQLHENHIHDPAYRRFLARLADPLLARLAPAARGLDYGCGPGPALAAVLTEAGHSMALYDPFFETDPAPLRNTYDFITCTEVVEHFHHPAEEFDRLGAMLRPGGWLAVMTCFQTEDARFARWHYRMDPTHVVFYRPETFARIAELRGWSCTIPVKDVVLLQVPAP